MVQRAFRIPALKSPFCTQSTLTFFFDQVDQPQSMCLAYLHTRIPPILFLDSGSSPLVESDSAKPGVAAFEAISFNKWHQPLWKLMDLTSLKQQLKAGQTRNLCHWWPVPSSCFHRTNCLPPFSSARVSYDILSKVFSLFLMTS